MFGNKVSPATLCPTSDSSLLVENASGAEDSQLCNSQASLFSSEPPSSMELFPDMHSQPQGDKFMQLSTTRSRQVLAAKAESARFQSENSLSRKFYLKYLKSGTQQDSPRNNSTSGEESQRSSLSSQPAAYDSWRTKQADKLENQQFMAEIQRAVKEGFKEIKGGLRSEIEELKGLLVEQKASITQHQQEVSTQILTTLADLKLHIEQQFHQQRECSQSLTTKLETQSSSLVLKLDWLCKDLRERIESWESHIESTLTSNHTTVLQCNNTHLDQSVPVQSKITTTDTTEREREANMIENDQTVPNQYNDLQNSPQNEPMKMLGNITDCHKSRLSSQNATDQSFSTTCDIDLTNQSPSTCNQVIASIMRRDDSSKPPKRMIDSHTPSAQRKGPKRQRIQSKTQPKPTEHTPHKRRSKRLQKTSIPLGYESEDSDAHTLAVVPRKRALIPKKPTQRTDCTITRTPTENSDTMTGVLRKSSQIPGKPCHKPLRTDTAIAKTPKTATVDMCFFSQTPKRGSTGRTDHISTSPGVQVLSTGDLQNIATEKTIANEKFHRSTEAAKRRVKVFAGMSNPTSALLELSNLRTKVTSDTYSDGSQ